jgi:hypothetical protein
MSAWRRVAIAKVPQLRTLIEQAESVGMLWIDLYIKFEMAHHPPPDETLIAGVYDYASWCLIRAHNDDIATSAIVSFYEHLPRDAEVRKQLHRWLSVEDFEGMKEVFRYHLSEEEHAEFVRQFYRGKAGLPLHEERKPKPGETGYALLQGRARKRQGS